MFLSCGRLGDFGDVGGANDDDVVRSDQPEGTAADVAAAKLKRQKEMQMAALQKKKSVCFEFVTTGKCSKEGKPGKICSFRHLPPDHPDAIAAVKGRSKSKTLRTSQVRRALTDPQRVACLECTRAEMARAAASATSGDLLTTRATLAARRLTSLRCRPVFPRQAAVQKEKKAVARAELFKVRRRDIALAPAPSSRARCGSRHPRRSLAPSSPSVVTFAASGCPFPLPPPALASATHPARCFQGDVNDPDTYKKNVILRTNKVPFKLPFLLPFLFSTFLYPTTAKHCSCSNRRTWQRGGPPRATQQPNNPTNQQPKDVEDIYKRWDELVPEEIYDTLAM